MFTELSYDLFGGKLVPLIGLRYFEDERDSDVRLERRAGLEQLEPETR